MLSFLGMADPVSSVTHLVAAVAVLVGAFFLIKKGRGNQGRLFSLVIYSFSLVFLFSMSGVYHLLTHETLARIVLQRLDYAGIWVLIAGSFTPIHVILFRGAWRWAILAFVWASAITGLVLQVIFFDSFPHWLSVSLFLGLGWMGMLTGYKFKSSFRQHSLKLLVLGGLFYSIGAVMDATQWPMIWPGVLEPHEIFHVFVMMGAFCHWRFIYEWADHPLHNTLLFHVTVLNGTFTAKSQGDNILVHAATPEDLKAAIKIKLEKKYRGSATPEVRLRYFEEEHLN